MTSRSPIRVLIADDHPIFRSGLTRLLEADGGIVVVGEAGDGAEAVAMARALRPDILLLDVAMPRSGGLDALRELSTAGLPTRTVLLTAEVGAVDVQTALRLGAVGVLLKSAATELLFKCLRVVAAGQYWIGRDTVGTLFEALVRTTPGRGGGAATARLTARELEVVRLVAEGCSNKDVAARLGIAEDTVKHHLSRAFDKTGASNRLELVLFAQQRGFAE